MKHLEHFQLPTFRQLCHFTTTNCTHTIWYLHTEEQVNKKNSWKTQVNMSILCFGLAIAIFLVTPLHSATLDNKIVNANLKLIAEGNIESVKNKLPELIKNHGEEPGLLLLQGVVQSNAKQAVPFYKKILDKYPNSEWIQHAYWRMIQYYSIIRDTSSARNLLAEFRKKCPTSPFLGVGTEAVRQTLPASLPSKEAPPLASTGAVHRPAYGLQVGLYSTKDAAESEKDNFIKTAKLRAEVQEKLVAGEKRYAVVIGKYDSEEEALIAKKLVEKSCKCAPIIYKLP